MRRIGANHLGRVGLTASLLAIIATGALHSQPTKPAPRPFDGKAAEAMVEDFCASCHNDIDEAGSLSFDDLKGTDIAQGKMPKSGKRSCARWCRMKCRPTPNASRRQRCAPVSCDGWRAGAMPLPPRIPIRAGPRCAG
jgi:hypothetical protein